MKKECLICPESKNIITCECCGNDYCKIHFEWHLGEKSNCKKHYDNKEKKGKEK